VIVLLDSSILLEAVKNRANLKEIVFLTEGKTQFAIPSPVFFELRHLARNRGIKGARAKAALKVLDSLKAFVLGCSIKKADDAMIALASEDVAVATLDLKVKRKAKERGAKVFTLKQGQYVQEL
jgi:rRNA-processing protein FCF1